MASHSQRAQELFCQGYNCAQSVLAAFSEDLGVDFETALRLSSSFGGGMGRLREVCGAVSGMFMVAGMKFGYSDPKNIEAKAKHYQLIQELAAQFRAENHSIICRELLGLGKGADSPVPEKRTDAYYRKRPCAELVVCAADIIERKIQSVQAEQRFI
ncbi:C-GCAxxG-C-C family protein [Marasmitruncus massiliensis]|uniref:C-GCAxxG-C-C family protein n=1 Tax=Marasmitruncus massiliensis TaxID=1944642 RepID=UPI000C79F5FC|nr:C-GCAxxG-C-C family protein [Marasmitruncus massiliensis]